MTTNSSNKLNEHRKKVAHLYYGGVCAVCERKFGKRFQFHHFSYEVEEKKWKDFRTLQGYWEYLWPKIHEEPKRFGLLCSKCHWHIDKVRGGLSRMGKQRLTRLYVNALYTDKGKGGVPNFPKEKLEKTLMECLERGNKE